LHETQKLFHFSYGIIHFWGYSFGIWNIGWD